MPKQTWRIKTEYSPEGDELYRPLVKVKLQPYARGLSTSGNALIDTGASISAIDKMIAHDYGFKVVGKRTVSTADGSQGKKPVYKAVLTISGPLGLTKEIEMIECDVFKNQKIIALIGTDILSEGSLVYDGKNSQFTLELPESV